MTAGLTETPIAVAAPRQRVAWRSRLLLAIGLSLLAWFLSRANWFEMARALAGVHWGWLAMGIAGNALLTPCLRAARFARLYSIRGRRLEMCGVMGQFGILNMITPLHAGDVPFLVLLKSRGLIGSLVEALPRWVLLRFGDLIGVLALCVLSAAVAPPAVEELRRYALAAQILLVVALAGVLVTIALVRWLPASDLPAAGASGWLRQTIWTLRRGMDGLASGSALAEMIAWSLLLWFWQGVVLAVQYRAFPTDLSTEAIWLVAVGVLAFSVLPIHAPLAIGTMHAVQVGLLRGISAYDLSQDKALGIAIGIHAAMVATMLLQGLFGAVLLARSAKKSIL